MAHDTQMLKGVLPLVLLQLVELESDYGYSLVVRLQDAGFSDLSEGTVYPALTRMESGGLLESRLVRSSSGPARKYYGLTPAGAAELRRSRDSWSTLVRLVDGVVATTKEST